MRRICVYLWFFALLVIYAGVVFAQGRNPFGNSPFAEDEFTGIGTVTGVTKDNGVAEFGVIVHYSGGKSAYAELVAKSFLLREKTEKIIESKTSSEMTQKAFAEILKKEYSKICETAKISGITFDWFEITESTVIPEIDGL